MFPIPKSYSKAPLVAGADILFTATHPTIVGSVIGTTTNKAERSGSVGILRAGATDVDWVSRLIPVASGASANLIPAKLSMDIGDALVVNASDQSIGQLIPSEPAGDFGPFPAAPTLLLSNDDGSKIVAFCSDAGIWLSEDGQITARKVYTGTTGQSIGAWFAGKFRAYTSATSSLTSANGVTWVTEVCVNAPTSTSFSAIGNMLVKDAELYGADGDQLKKSSDGLTFTNHGVAVASGTATQSGFTWTGVNWVSVGYTSGSTSIVKYASAGATTWTASTGVIFTNDISGKGVASAGAVVVVADNLNNAAISVDHGVTFSLEPPLYNYGSYRVVVSAGGQIIIAASTENALSGGGRFVPVPSAGTTGDFRITPYCPAFAVNANGLIYPGKRSVDATLSRRGGFTVTANVLEMQP